MLPTTPKTTRTTMAKSVAKPMPKSPSGTALAGAAEKRAADMAARKTQMDAKAASRKTAFEAMKAQGAAASADKRARLETKLAEQKTKMADKSARLETKLAERKTKMEAMRAQRTAQKGTGMGMAGRRMNPAMAAKKPV